jgi:glycosyltransferase involved in cell wall biosynthesis
VEELTRHLALSLVETGDQVEVWTPHPDDATPETVEVLDGLVVRRLPMPLPATNLAAIRRSAITGTRTLFSLRNAVAAFRPDVLHVQCYGPNGAYAHALSRLSSLPLVITLQGETLMDDTDIFDISRVLRSSLRSSLRGAAAVTGCSAFTLADAEDRFGLEPARGRVIPNGVDLHGDPAPQNATPDEPTSFVVPGRQPGHPYVLALGRVVEKKGFDLLLGAYAAIEPGQRTADLVIGGQGAALAGLRHQASVLGIADRVHFVGRLSRQQVAEAMAGASMFVMPSRLEPFGIVILEAWRAGTPVVATSRGGPPEFVRDGRDGLLVDPFDTAGFAAALESLLLDPERRERIGRAGQTRVQEFGWASIADRYRQVYASVVGDMVTQSPAKTAAAKTPAAKTAATKTAAAKTAAAEVAVQEESLR